MLFLASWKRRKFSIFAKSFEKARVPNGHTQIHEDGHSGFTHYCVELLNEHHLVYFGYFLRPSAWRCGHTVPRFLCVYNNVFLCSGLTEEKLYRDMCFFHRKKIMLFLTLCIIACVQMRAADGDTFTANTQEGIVMSFKIISEIDKTVQVGNGSIASSISQSTSGAVTIPQQIEKSGVV